MKNKLQNLFRGVINSLKMAYCYWQANRRIRAVKRQYPYSEGARCAWPPTPGSTTGYDADGVTTIRWGTEGLLQSPLPSVGYYTVTRFDERQLVDNIKLPNGNGPTATRVLITDGQQWNVTVRDDTTMTPPRVGATVAVVDGGGFKGNVGLVYTAVVVESNYETAVKQAGERVMVLESLTLVDDSASSGQV